MDVEPGQRYRIAYAYAGNPETSDQAREVPRRGRSRHGDRARASSTGRTTQSMGWTSAVTAFVATGDRATIWLIPTSPGGGGAALDNIQIAPVSTCSTTVIASWNCKSWTDQSGASGLAELSYGHTGCTALDTALAALGGGWAGGWTTPWIWAHQYTRNGEGPVAFTRTVRISRPGEPPAATGTALGDDVMTASVDGDSGPLPAASRRRRPPTSSWLRASTR